MTVARWFSKTLDKFYHVVLHMNNWGRMLLLVRWAQLFWVMKGSRVIHLNIVSKKLDTDVVSAKDSTMLKLELVWVR